MLNTSVHYKILPTFLYENFHNITIWKYEDLLYKLHFRLTAVLSLKALSFQSTQIEKKITRSLKNINFSTTFESKYALMNTKLLQQRALLTFSHIPKHSKLTESIKIRDRLSTDRLVGFLIFITRSKPKM